MRSNRRYWLLLAALLTGPAACDAVPEPGRIAVGEPAPAFAAPDLKGDTLALADLRGAPVLLNVWATWCGPCRREMPDLQTIQEEYADRGLRVLGVSIDQAQARAEIENFLQTHGITFTILHDAPGRVTRTFRTVGVPETFLIGPDGTLRGRWIGQVEAAALRRGLDALLGD